MKRKRLRAKLAVVIFFLLGTSAFGKNLDTLVRILSPAFLGQQGVSICTDMPLDTETQSTLSRLNAYASYMKRRVTDGLTEPETQFVLKSSADKAKVQIDEVVRLLKLAPAQEISWCSENLMNIAQKVLSTYAFDKQSIEKMVDDDDKTSSNFWVLHWPLLEWSGTVVSFAVACGKRLCDKNKVFKREQRFSSFSAAFATFAFVG